MPRIGGNIIGGHHKETHQTGGSDEVSVEDLAGQTTELETHEADIDVHMRDMLQSPKVGNYHLLNPFKTSRIDTSGPGADTIYAFPFVAVRAMTIDRLAVHVTTAHAGKTCRLGIYSDDGNGAPGDLVVDAGTVSVASTGVKAATIDEALTPGVYWLVIHGDSASAKVTGYNPAHCMFGFPTTDFQETWRAGAYLSRAFASGLPDPFGTATGEITTAMCVFARVASLD